MNCSEFVSAANSTAPYLYKFVTAIANFTTAWTLCTSTNSSLAIIRDYETHSFLNVTSGPQNTWIGLNHTTSPMWTWADGVTVGVRTPYWASNQPDLSDTCAYISAIAVPTFFGLIDDINCSRIYKSFCEIDGKHLTIYIQGFA
jgi:hypothetical protein